MPETELLVETRSTDGDVNNELLERVRRIATSAAAMHDLDIEIQLIGQATTASSDPEMVEAVTRAAQDCIGVSKVTESCNIGASEDATFLMRRVQEQGGNTVYMVVGVSNPAPHHSEEFDIDERALPIAVELLERLVRQNSASSVR